jgi:peptidoglycan DL-endopeptidase CwlO
MKLLFGLLGLLAFSLAALPVIVVSVIATHPWLAVGMLVAPIAPNTIPEQRDVVAIAEQWLGVPYLFGGCSRSGIDCSCLVQLVYRAAGVNLPRTAAEQWSAVRRIDQKDLQPGDLVFFANTYMPGISHVGIYVGNRLQINAPSEGQRVAVQPVFDGYWGAHYVGAGRVTR